MKENEWDNFINTPDEILEHLPEWQQFLIKELRKHDEFIKNWSNMTEEEKRKHWTEKLEFNEKHAEEYSEKAMKIRKMLNSGRPVDEWGKLGKEDKLKEVKLDPVPKFDTIQQIVYYVEKEALRRIEKRVSQKH
jgi:hypothetical protein